MFFNIAVNMFIVFLCAVKSQDKVVSKVKKYFLKSDTRNAQLKISCKQELSVLMAEGRKAN